MADAGDGMLEEGKEIEGGEVVRDLVRPIAPVGLKAGEEERMGEVRRVVDAVLRVFNVLQLSAIATRLLAVSIGLLAAPFDLSIFLRDLTAEGEDGEFCEAK